MKKFKHEWLTERFIYLIESGNLKAGDKLPSLRMLSKQQGISLMTAYHSVNTLQGLGYVESRPKSGYYARKPLRSANFKGHKPLEKKRSTDHIDELVQLVYGRDRTKEQLSFALNTPDLALLPQAKLKQSLLYVNRHKNDSCLQYGPVAGIPELREQIAVLLGNSGIQANSEELLITVGCQEAINLAIIASTKPGDKILIESPTYFGIFKAIIAQGRIPIEVETDFNHGIVRQQLFQAIEVHQPKACLLVTNYSSPLGATIPDEDKQKIVTHLQDKGVVLIENDIYGELYYGQKRPRTCKSFDQNGNVIYCSSFSKSLAPGYRVGWIESGKFYHKIFQAKVNQSVATAPLPQEILAHFLKNGRYDLHLKRLRKQLHTQSLQYQQAITQYFPKDTIVSKPGGGFVLWIELNSTVDTLQLLHTAIQQNISFAPGQLFSLEKDLHHYLRISIGRPFDAKVEEAIRALGGMVKLKATST
ncbi:MAG: PLP-dependent aminotransferase family protein [Saprospiraceae bacterium]